MKLRAVQFNPYYCDDAIGAPITTWDTSHDLSIIDADGARWYIGSYQHAYLATKAGQKIEASGIIPEGSVRK